MDTTIVHTFLASAARRGAADALRHKAAGSWRAISWSEYARRVRLAARGFMDLGLQPGGAVAILGGNRWEWLVADLAAMAAGGVPAPIYQTSSAEQASFVAGHCEAKIAVVENAAQARKLAKVDTLVVMDPAGAPAGAVRFEDLLARGEKVPDGQLDGRLAAAKPTDLATLIYTSGTTGAPKGVMLTHKNLVFTARALVEQAGLRPGEEMLSYLPLSHIAEQLVSIHVPATVGATVSFLESLEKLGDNLREVRPTLFLGVPRIWEKIQAKMVEAGASSPRVRRELVAWARRVGLAGGQAVQRGGRRPLLYPVADRIVFQKVRDKLGLDRCRFAVTAAAPIARATLDFFLSLGLTIYEVYGMSENTGPATVSVAGAVRTGTCGKALLGTQVRIAPDGEILMKGEHVFSGYLKDRAATSEALDADGWLHSGDIGALDADGYLRVTDRKKELIVTAGGKNVAPQAIEALLKAIPGVAQAAVVGDRRRFVAALLTLDPETSPRVAVACGARGRTPEDLAGDAAFRAYLQRQIDDVNARVSSVESIRKFTILPAEWTVDGGELTPTMKLKRRVLAEKYAAAIEAMYA